MPLTENQYSEIFEKISEGKSLASCLREIPCSFGKFYDGLDNNSKLSERYARARRHQSEASQSRIVQIIEDVLASRVDPQAARVAIDALKWNAAKLHPAIYAEKTSLLGDNNGNAPTELIIKWGQPKDKVIKTIETLEEEPKAIEQ